MRMKLLGVEFAPLLIPLNRRLQTLVAFIWIFSFLSGATIGCFILTYLMLYTNFWMWSLIYIAWLIFDRDSCNRGGRYWRWMRGLKMWNHFRDYFPVRLVKTADLDPEKSYLFTSQPHGVLCAGAFASFATDALSFSSLFKGLRSRLIVLEGQFWFPIYREFLIALGACSSTKESLTHLFTKEKNSAFVLVTGGVLEAMEGSTNGIQLVLNRRKGFIKLAIKHGIPIVPTFSFGEAGLYDILYSPPGSRIRKIQEFFEKRCKFSPIMFNGRGLFQYNFGIVPRRKPVTVVVGKPIEIPQDDNPTRELIEETHALYIEKVKSLYEEYNPIYGDPKLRLIVS